MTKTLRIKEILNDDELFNQYKKLSASEKSAIKQELGELLTDEVNDWLDKSKSPAANGKFKAKLKSGATSILFDTGELRSDFEYEENRDGIEFGLFNDDQAAKAYGHHTNMKGHPWLDGKVGIRQIIPEKSDTFKKSTMNKLKRAIEDFL